MSQDEWDSFPIKPTTTGPALSPPLQPPGMSSSLDRTALRSANAELSVLERDEVTTGDASLKKNTSYLKRIRTALPASDQTDSLIREIAQLRLDKYLSELVQAVSEGCSRVKVGQDVSAAVKVISALHQRFGSEAFTSPLVSTLTAQCKPPSSATASSKGSSSSSNNAASVPAEQREKEESQRVAKQRALLRLLAELDVVGLVSPGKSQQQQPHPAGSVTLHLVQDLLLAQDKELLLPHASLALSLTKHSSFLLSISSSQNDPTPQETPLIQPDIQAKFTSTLTTFYNSLSARAVKERAHLLAQEKSNNEAYIRHGELFEDRKQNFERLVARWDKLWAATQSLAEALSLDLPDLPEAQTDASGGSSGLVVSANQSLSQQTGDGETMVDPRFGDEEEMRFYLELKDLHAGDRQGEVTSTVPAESMQEETDGNEQEGGEKSERCALVAMHLTPNPADGLALSVRPTAN